MRMAVCLLIVGVVLVVASLTGMAYCWQAELTNTSALLGFVGSLVVFLGTVGWGTAYGVIRGSRWADDYIRDLVSSSIQSARETADETIENIPETIIGGIEKSLKKTRDRFFGESRDVRPWRRTTLQPREVEGYSRSDDKTGMTEEYAAHEAADAEENATRYRMRIDRAMSDFRDARKQQHDQSEE